MLHLKLIVILLSVKVDVVKGPLSLLEFAYEVIDIELREVELSDAHTVLNARVAHLSRLFFVFVGE